MTPDAHITQVARQLVNARRSGQPAPASAVNDAASAYAVQDAVARSLNWFPGGIASHWKSGGASLQSERTHAPLPPDGIFDHPFDARGHGFVLRGIEAEIALRLRVPVNASLASGLDDATAATLVDNMCAAIEIVDSRWIEGMQAPAWARLADLQSHGALVLGTWVPFGSRDWASQTCTVSIGAQETRRFQGTHALGSPGAVLVSWLRHATRSGAIVPAGTVVTTGTWCGLLQARAGDTAQVEFDGIGLVRARF